MSKTKGNSATTLLDVVSQALRSHSPAARIARLRRHEPLQTKADELAAWLNEVGGQVNAALLLAIETAEGEALRADVAPKVKRDDARQEGMKKLRGSKMPKLDEWLDKQDLKLTSDKLWALLPDDSMTDVYRDGEEVFENSARSSSRGERTITHHSKRDGFDKRVTEARNRRKRR